MTEKITTNQELKDYLFDSIPKELKEAFRKNKDKITTYFQQENGVIFSFNHDEFVLDTLSLNGFDERFLGEYKDAIKEHDWIKSQKELDDVKEIISFLKERTPEEVDELNRLSKIEYHKKKIKRLEEKE